MRLFKRNRSAAEYRRDFENITGKYDDFSSPEDRENRAEYDKVCNRLTHGVADLITSRSPIFLDEGGNEIEWLRDEWEWRFQELFRNVIISSRIHGYCVVENIEGDIGGREWLIHDPTDIMMIRYGKDRNVEKYQIQERFDGGRETSITFAPITRSLFPEDVIHHFIGKFDLSLQGISALKPVWASCCRIEEIEASMAEYDIRVGKGVLCITVDGHTYANEYDQLASALKKMNNRGFLILKESVDGNPPKIEWEHAKSGTDFSKDVHEIAKFISANTGFSLRFICSEARGTMSTATEDRKHDYENLKGIFGQYKPFIRKLFDFLEGDINSMVAKIEWDSGENIEEDEEIKPVRVMK